MRESVVKETVHDVSCSDAFESVNLKKKGAGAWEPKRMHTIDSFGQVEMVSDRER